MIIRINSKREKNLLINPGRFTFGVVSALLKMSELRPKPMIFLEGCTALTTTRPHNSVVVGSNPTCAIKES
jgi:hypothetical protein